MLPYYEIPPLKLGPLTAHPFGILVATGVFLGTTLTEKRAARLQLDLRVLNEVIGYLLLFGFAGAHLYSAIFYFPERIVENPLYLLKFWDGISSFGGFLGGTFGTVFAIKKNKVSFWPYGDVIIVAFVLAWIFGRLGCTVAFDHPGDVTDFALAMPYPGSDKVSPGVRHNLGMYEAIWAMVVSGFFYLQRKRAHFSGWYLSMTLLMYMPFRFALDFMRAEDKRYFGFTAGQFAAVVLMAAGVALFYQRKKVNDIQQPIPDELPSVAAKKGAPRRA